MAIFLTSISVSPQRKTGINSTTAIATPITITSGGTGPPPLNNQCNKEESGAAITDPTVVGESTL